MLNVAELRNLSEEELLEKVSSLKKELMQYRFQSKTGKLEQQSVIKNVRRDIARVLTIANEKSAEEQSVSPVIPAPKKSVKQVAVKKPVVKAAVKKSGVKKEVKK